MKLNKILTRSTAIFSLSALSLLATSSHADIVHLDDVIIEFSLCVGNDCVNGESFGFDTVRLKENNLRIHFDDTSVSASFPRNDWRIVINDTANGGASFFGIEDSTAGRRPFQIDAGAPANAIRVDSAGDVGLGTANPVVELHVVDGDSPTLRLEQNGSSGFTPQTFDMAANETNFFIRDVTNGSQLPLRIIPGADTNALYIDSNNEIGMGTNNPRAALHIVEADAPVGTAIRLTDNTAGTAAVDAIFQYQNDLIRIAFADGDGVGEWSLDTLGNVVIAGTITTSGSCSMGCDAVFDADYDLPSIEEHAEYMFSNKHLPVVGPTQTGPINLSDKVTAMLNELEKAHIYIAQINDEKKQLKEQLETQEERLKKLENLQMNNLQ